MLAGLLAFTLPHVRLRKAHAWEVISKYNRVYLCALTPHLPSTHPQLTMSSVSRINFSLIFRKTNSYVKITFQTS